MVLPRLAIMDLDDSHVRESAVIEQPGQHVSSTMREDVGVVRTRA